MNIKGAKSYAWLHVGKIVGDVSVASMIKFIQDNWPNVSVKCYKLLTKGQNSSFKIGIESKLINSFLNSNLWPEGVEVKEFKFFRKSGFHRTPRTKQN